MAKLKYDRTRECCYPDLRSVLMVHIREPKIKVSLALYSVSNLNANFNDA